jgi:hypothetical protein
VANPEHLAILKQGGKVWNRHRWNDPFVFLDLSGADLSGIQLVGADLRGANLDGTNLSGAHLTDVVLSGAHLHDTNFTRARFHWVLMVNVDLSEAVGLETVVHAGPSSFGLDTFYLSRGKIPETFLRGAGVPENFVAFMKSLTGFAFEFYSCFISYSTKDQQFADRLYTDMQANGARSFLATEDLKIGDPFRQRIDESISMHDKLLLVLSANSVQSPWVHDEAEAALERERREKRLVLFPLRLDDAVMQTSTA